ncbi:VPLPA-CTERM sorting domain-containing protein [Mangrovicoccus ximenensis]|uniref:VPLPA-CTERM sorting domain-containing protein n=1 Tax=Mangrovicoccus ximenensis TaxID=1911570 RepID=UPI000D37F4FE|nr:VPLPA-CTERM sorting domain-containing protein [Mangrovicoccus ximenensis]
MKSFLLAATLAVAAPLAASAAVVNFDVAADDYQGGFDRLSAGEVSTWNFTALEDLTFDVSFTINGQTQSVNRLSYSVNGGAAQELTGAVSGSVGAFTLRFEGEALQTGETYSVSFFDAPEDQLQLEVLFSGVFTSPSDSAGATPPAPPAAVPLPASVMLLGAGLAGLGAARARKRG